ncbi:MAG: hypothetical protein R2708_15755 [Vicinamibacterales bacterium]
MTTRERLKEAADAIRAELAERRGFLEQEGRVLGAAPPPARCSISR